MKLVSFETAKDEHFTIRLEVHKYEDMEEVKSYRKLWKKAGFTQLLLTPEQDGFLVIYERRLELK